MSDPQLMSLGSKRGVGSLGSICDSRWPLWTACLSLCSSASLDSSSLAGEGKSRKVLLPLALCLFPFLPLPLPCPLAIFDYVRVRKSVHSWVYQVQAIWRNLRGAILGKGCFILVKVRITEDIINRRIEIKTTLFLPQSIQRC